MSRMAELYGQGMTMREIAEELGCRYEHVRWSLKREGVAIRETHKSRAVAFALRIKLTPPEMVRLYREGWSLRQVSERARADPKYVRKHLLEAGITLRTRAEGIRLAKGRKNRRASRPPQVLVKRQFQGQRVDPPPPMSSSELFDLHDLSASEKMLVYRMVGAIEKRQYGEPERILNQAGISSCRRQYHLMTCAIAAAKEAGVSFGRPRITQESA